MAGERPDDEENLLPTRPLDVGERLPGDHTTEEPSRRDSDPTEKPSRRAPAPHERRRLSPLIGIGALILLVVAGWALSATAVSFTRYGHDLRTNVILMVSDGFGPASEGLARAFVQSLHSAGHPLVQPGGRYDFTSAGFGGKLGVGRGGLGVLPLDRLLVGQSRTRSSNSLVTDSAAGATAFSCARKSYNGAIAVDPDRQPCGTVLEAAKHKGWLTGLIATSRITHATPACFYAHVVDRDQESDIAGMLVDSHPLSHLQVDFALGGGRCFFEPNTSSTSCRSDATDLLAAAAKNQLSVITTLSQLRSLPNDSLALGTIGLFNRDHMNYELDRIAMPSESREPSLVEMTNKALAVLSSAVNKKGAPGMFLMVEGSRIDMAGHSNDPAAHVHDILAYQEAVVAVKAFVDAENKRGMPSVMISVSDHETGGLTLARQLTSAYPDYLYLPDALHNATGSTIALAARLRAGSTRAEIARLVNRGLGFGDSTDDELARLEESLGDTWALHSKLGDMASRRAQLGWTTTGHSGVDVNLYCSGYQCDRLRGSRDNTEIGAFISDILELDLEAVTRDLRRTTKAWFKPAGSTQRTIGLAHFHGSDAGAGSSHPMHLYLDEADPPRRSM